MMFSAITICKLSTSALFSDSDHVFPPLSTKILTILLILTPGFNVQNFHFHAFLMCPLVPYMTDRYSFYSSTSNALILWKVQDVFKGKQGGTSPNKSHSKAISFS